MGTSIATVCGKSLIAGRRSAAERKMTLIELAGARQLGVLPQRSLNRQLEQLAETVAQRLHQRLDPELQRIPVNEQEATILFVSRTIEETHFDDGMLFDSNLSAEALYRVAYKYSQQLQKQYVLSEPARQLFEIMLREAIEHLTEVIITLPSFQGRGIEEILSRNSEVIDLLNEVLTRMPKRGDTLGARNNEDNEFELKYLRELARKLDKVEIFGVTNAGPSRRYSLDAAYIGLSVSASSMPGTHRDAPTETLSADLVISKARRIYLRGEAGSGKTTLVRWLALLCAQRRHSEPLKAWNRAVPFVVELRRFADLSLPAVSAFVEYASQPLAELAPEKWAQTLLSQGRGVVLLDGVDEFSQNRRHELHEWIADLTGAYPDATFIVTSRPSASNADWLEEFEFFTAELLPMTRPYVERFISQWHEAIALDGIHDDRDQIGEYRRSLLATFKKSRALRQLAENPLLCALLCALNWNRRQQLPTRRLEIYRTALEMLLDRRDAERNIPSSSTISLRFDDKVAILSDLAYWFAVNELSDAERGRVVEKVQRSVDHMPHVSESADEILAFLLERSGVLREPVNQRVDFIHKTFLEYLAASRIVQEGSIELLINNAERDAYSEIIVMASGFARQREAEVLLTAILNAADQAEGSKAAKLNFLAATCTEVVTRIDPELRQRIITRMEALVPPADQATARVLASVGEEIVTMLPIESDKLSEPEAAATLLTAGLIGGDDALALIEAYRDDRRGRVHRARIEAWSHFDPVQYAQRCFGDAGLWPISIRDPQVVLGLKHIKNVSEVALQFTGGVALEIFAQIEDCSIVRRIGLNDNQSISSLEPIRRFEALTSLSLKDCHQIDTYEQLVSLTNLSALQVQGCGGILDRESITALSGLRSLALDVDIAGSMSGLVDEFPRMKALQLSGPMALRETAELGGGLQLRKLILRGCNSIRELTGLGNFGLRQLEIELQNLSTLIGISEAPDLRSLSIVGSRHIQDYSFLTRLPNLEYLILDDCGIDDIGVLSACRKLKRVALLQCDVISDLEVLLELPKLRQFDFHAGDSISAMAFKRVAARLNDRDVASVTSLQAGASPQGPSEDDDWNESEVIVDEDPLEQYLRHPEEYETWR
ncbi:NACHT domain-containing protein [Mycolicibacterium doricum]|uniref:NACHT domain-containing protein n=1 Tax=Mycolicibacterium doricum TaxID=126673 RepID=UPI0035566A9E